MSPIDNIWRPDLQPGGHWQARRRFETPEEYFEEPEEPAIHFPPGVAKEIDSQVFATDDECQARCDDLNA